LDNFFKSFDQFFNENFIGHYDSPIKIVALVIDLIIVIFLLYKAVKSFKDTRVWQLLKGILVLVIVTFLSGLLNLNILYSILSSIMTYGVFLLIVVFQPELRRALEELGSTNRFRKFFETGNDKDGKKKENIYRIAIAAEELSKTHTGALMVIERDIKIQDIIATGIPIESEISPQLLCNIFVPNTPLHDGAVIIRNGKIAAAACMLPLSDDKSISKELGTRHRAAVGISKESDAIVVVVSEETGKISVAKDGTLLTDLKDDILKKVLIKNLITEPNQKAKEAKEAKQKQDLEAKEAIKQLKKLEKENKKLEKEKKKAEEKVEQAEMKAQQAIEQIEQINDNK
jgi:diadenylate cyclase